MPIVRSPPALMVKLTTSETVPELMSTPFIVSAVAAVIAPDAEMVVTPETAPAPVMVQVLLDKVSDAPMFTWLALPESSVIAALLDEMLPELICRVSPEATIKLPDDESSVKSAAPPEDTVTAPEPV